MGVIEQVRAKPTLDTSWEALKDQRKIPNGLYLFSKIDPPEVVAHYLKDLASQGVDISEFSVDWLPDHPPNFMKRIPPVPLDDSPSKSLPPSRSVKLNPLASSLPQTTPLYTQSETPPSTTKPSNLPSLKFNLATTTLPVSEAEMLNETTSPSSFTPSSPPYYILSSDTEPSDPQSPTLAQLQAPTPPSKQQPTTPPAQITPPPSDIPTIPTYEDIIIPTQTPADTNQTPPPSPSSNSEPELAFPTLEEAITLFAESSVEKIKSLSVNSDISDDPSAVRIYWNLVIRWMTSEAFKLKGLSEQVRNDFVRDDGVRLQARLVREAEEKARKEVEEKACLEEEQRIKEAEEKVADEVVAAAAAAEAEAKAKAEAAEAAHITVEEATKASADALTQGEQSNSGFAPLVLRTLEELQKGQQVVRARLDHQDSVNNNIQNLLTQLLQRMLPPPNP
ncbi:hypothetical protein KIW84_011437 [Lathyrus oleraceus]|uniref:Uncharacterized protein n=1 Tax=Pisum sativum TaxID=3888 RepID=A0A9D5BEW9_PEA|nr:hypothetical protein KIW84_011437 [Pisum sativum]